MKGTLLFSTALILLLLPSFSEAQDRLRIKPEEVRIRSEYDRGEVATKAPPAKPSTKTAAASKAVIAKPPRTIVKREFRETVAASPTTEKPAATTRARFANNPVTGKFIIPVMGAKQVLTHKINLSTEKRGVYLVIEDGRIYVSSSFFSERDGRPYHGSNDYPLPIGTAIVASDGGVVVHAGYTEGYGPVVIIKHAADRYTFYGHNKRNLVKIGQIVRQGELIALSGDEWNGQAHLHFWALDSYESSQNSNGTWVIHRQAPYSYERMKAIYPWAVR